MSALRVLGDRIIVRPDPPLKETAGGIVIPDVMSYDSETVGTVVAVGDGPVTAKGIPLDHLVQVGDYVLFPAEVGHELSDLDGEPLLVMREVDVLAVLED